METRLRPDGSAAMASSHERADLPQRCVDALDALREGATTGPLLVRGRDAGLRSAALSAMVGRAAADGIVVGVQHGASRIPTGTGAATPPPAPPAAPGPSSAASLLIEAIAPVAAHAVQRRPGLAVVTVLRRALEVARARREETGGAGPAIRELSRLVHCLAETLDETRDPGLVVIDGLPFDADVEDLLVAVGRAVPLATPLGLVVGVLPMPAPEAWLTLDLREPPDWPADGTRAAVDALRPAERRYLRTVAELADDDGIAAAGAVARALGDTTRFSAEHSALTPLRDALVTAGLLAAGRGTVQLTRPGTEALLIGS